MENSNVNNQQSVDQRVIDDVEVNIHIIYTKVQSPIYQLVELNVKFNILLKSNSLTCLLFF